MAARSLFEFRNQDAVDPAALRERLKAILRRDFAIRETALVPEAQSVRDLGLD